MDIVTLKRIGTNAFAVHAFDPYNSADTSSKWLVARWSITDEGKRYFCKVERNQLYGKFVVTEPRDGERLKI